MILIPKTIKYKINPPIKMIKAVLFDLDGVLVDAVKLHQQAFIEAILPYRYMSEEEHMRDFNGIPTKKKLEKLGFSEELKEIIYERKQEKTILLIRKTIKEIPQVTETINKIREMEIPFAVCSNSIRQSLEEFLSQVNINGFSFLISNQDVEKSKPDPEMYLKAMEKLGLKELPFRFDREGCKILYEGK